jgi:hypothetical protein
LRCIVRSPPQPSVPFEALANEEWNSHRKGYKEIL